MASNLSFFTFNRKNNTNILHINIIYQPVEYYVIISAKKRIIWMQGARHGFINGKQHVECIVLLTLWFIILSCLGRCNKRPSRNIMLNIYWSRNQPARIRSPFSSMVSAHTMRVYCVHTMYVCRARVPTVQFVFKHACSKINLCICTSVYKFNIDELLLKLLAKRGSLTCFMYLPVQAARACQRQNRLTRCSHRTEHSAHVLKGVVFRAQMLFNRLHF